MKVELSGEQIVLITEIISQAPCNGPMTAVIQMAHRVEPILKILSDAHAENSKPKV